MATLYPGEFRRIIEKCGQLQGVAVYDCFRPNIPDHGSMRELREVLIRATAIYVISLASYGHLLSLQGLTSGWSAELWLRPLTYLFFPILPAVELLCRFTRVCVRTLRGKRAPIRYWIATVAGSCVAVSGSAKRVEEIEPSDLRFINRKRNLVWCGRIIVLFSVLAQCVGSLAIWYRSVYLFSDRWNAFGGVDRKTSDMVLGSAVSVLNSMLITFLNSDWEYNRPIEPIHLSEVQQDPENNITGDISTAAESHTASKMQPSTGTGCILHTRMKRILRYIYERNEVFAAHLSKYFPAQFQFTVEHALVAQLLAEALDRGFWKAPGCDPLMSILARKTPNDPWQSWCAKERWPYPSNRMWYTMRHIAQLVTGEYVPPGIALPVAFYLVVARILLVDIVSLLALARGSRNLAHKPFLRHVESTYTWVLGGRTILSFPLALTGILFHVILRIVQLATAIRWAQWDGAGNEDISRENWFVLMLYYERYRDPWYDSMLVL